MVSSLINLPWFKANHYLTPFQSESPSLQFLLFVRGKSDRMKKFFSSFLVKHLHKLFVLIFIVGGLLVILWIWSEY